ncbi:phage tail sheath family protein [Pseudoduganella sp. HUAS MS19]
MPVAVNYPGVYIQEVPSGVRTVTGVATSIAAFIGWAPKGPVDRAGLVLSWPDYFRQYGGMDKRSLLGYAVSHFFANGGQQAYIVRLATLDSDTAADNAVAASVTLGELTVTAANPGIWSHDYAIVTRQRPDEPTRFQLQVMNIKLDPKGVPVEVFENLSMLPGDARFVESVLKNGSAFVTAEVADNATDPPDDTDIAADGIIPDTAKLTGGQDGVVLAPTDDAFSTAALPADGTGGAYLLDYIDLFNILSVPGLSKDTTLAALEGFCRKRRAFLIADCAENATFTNQKDGPTGLTGEDAINAAFYFPWVSAPDPLAENRLRLFPPAGFVAGLYAKTDGARGVWKAPAGTDASLTGVAGVAVPLTDLENGVLNQQAVNCIRNFSVYGTILWGARTLRGNDAVGSEWKYVPVRRTALFIEESLFRALKWVVFEPNDEPLWAQIRLNVGAFMHNLFRQGAFQGRTPQEAYFVKCDKETTTQNDINLGIVNIAVGFAPLKPAEFVVVQIQQIAGQIAV